MLWYLVGIGIIIGIFWEIAKNKSWNSNTQLAKSSIMFVGDGSYDFDIVGEASYQAALESIAGRSDESAEYYCMATLAPEPSNQYDSNAIRVDIDGKTVGYISRNMTGDFHPLLKGRKAQADAVIVGGWDRGSRGSGNFGVKLDISEPIRIE